MSPQKRSLMLTFFGSALAEKVQAGADTATLKCLASMDRAHRDTVFQVTMLVRRDAILSSNKKLLDKEGGGIVGSRSNKPAVVAPTPARCEGPL